MVNKTQKVCSLNIPITHTQLNTKSTAAVQMVWTALLKLESDGIRKSMSLQKLPTIHA